jgi:hypothetical protein
VRDLRVTPDSLWSQSLSVTPQVNSVISLAFDYEGGLPAARKSRRFEGGDKVCVRCRCLVLAGWRSGRIFAVWRNTTLQQAVQSKVGVVTIGGTSAGTHIMSSSIYDPSPANEGVGSDAAAKTPRA